jgi:hypothetical protein
MTTFALDDDWVEIDADDYAEDEDMFGTALIGKVLAIFPGGETRYYGLFEPEG